MRRRSDLPTSAVVVLTHSNHRVDSLRRAISSVLAQSHRPDEIVVVVDSNRELLECCRNHLDPSIKVVECAGVGNNAVARNVGLDATRQEVVVYLDDDAEARVDWLERLLEPYACARTVGVGGFVTPIWQAPRPSWFPPELDWVVGCCYAGMADEGNVRNLIGANMSFRREIVAAVGGFAAEFGRSRFTPFGCEETELCIKLRAHDPDAELVLTRSAVVAHQVPSTRARLRYLLQQCHSEGRAKAALQLSYPNQSALSPEGQYVRRVVPVAIMRGISESLAGQPEGILRSATLVAGVGAAAVGYLEGIARCRLPGRTDRRGAA